MLEMLKKNQFFASHGHCLLFSDFKDSQRIDWFKIEINCQKFLHGIHLEIKKTIFYPSQLAVSKFRDGLFQLLNCYLKVRWVWILFVQRNSLETENIGSERQPLLSNSEIICVELRSRKSSQINKTFTVTVKAEVTTVVVRFISTTVIALTVGDSL